MKGYYITFLSASELNNPNSGVWKKVQSQIETFTNLGIDIALFNFSITNLFHKIQSKIYPYYFTKQLSQNFFLCDFYYIRYCYSTIPFVELIKKIKQYGKSKIIIEIPTYPYYKEFQSCLSKFTLFSDKLLSKQLKKHVDRIVTFFKYETIFDIPVIQTINGINCSLIPIRNNVEREDTSLHLIAVAFFAKWHGYDRLIEGLNQYYKGKTGQKVYIHFVGYGQELPYYKKLVQQYDLSEYVIFHGPLAGEKLTELFNKVTIAVGSLGDHRRKIYVSSELKSKEYFARGMPMISAGKIDVLPQAFEYCLYVPADESPVIIKDIITFYQNLLSQKDISEMIHEIRQFAETYCDMSITMKPVIDYLFDT
jgi:glycosyltransferase involved in cell wall biosynthesis